MLNRAELYRLKAEECDRRARAARGGVRKIWLSAADDYRYLAELKRHLVAFDRRVPLRSAEVV